MRLQSEYYGKGPTRAKAYITDDIVAQVTGRVVKVFMSETDVDADVSVEFFILGEERTDMTDFQGESGTAPEAS